MSTLVKGRVKKGEIGKIGTKEYVITQVLDDIVMVKRTGDNVPAKEAEKDYKIKYVSKRFEQLFPQFFDEGDAPEEEIIEDEEEASAEDKDKKPSKKKAAAKKPVEEDDEEDELDFPFENETQEEFLDTLDSLRSTKRAVYLAGKCGVNYLADMIVLNLKNLDKMKMDYNKFVEYVLGENPLEVDRPESLDKEALFEFMRNAVKKGRKRFTEEDYKSVLGMVPVSEQEYVFFCLDYDSMVEGLGDLKIKDEWLELLD